jgi:hypothetical protein
MPTSSFSTAKNVKAATAPKISDRESTVALLLSSRTDSGSAYLHTRREAAAC